MGINKINLKLLTNIIKYDIMVYVKEVRILKKCWMCAYFNNSIEDKEHCGKCMKTKNKEGFKLWIEDEEE